MSKPDNQLQKPTMLLILPYAYRILNLAFDFFQKKLKGFEMPAKKKPKLDACYHKFKRAMPKTSAYRSGHIVPCCKIGTQNYNIGGKKHGKSKKA